MGGEQGNRRARPGSPIRVGRYLLFDVLASGGMAQVHLARLEGDAGFSRVVAIKRLHSHLLADRAFTAMFRDEARLVARIRHPNVVPILDVVSLPDELFLVMEYVSGESLAQLLRQSRATGQKPPPDVVSAIVVGMLKGLHAAHEAKNESGAPLRIVHRDVSPQNVVVGDDGFARVLDFGIAHASERLQSTSTGSLKGKLEYMAPEQLGGEVVDRRTDVYASGVLLWEALTGVRLFKGQNDGHTVNLIKAGVSLPPSEHAPELPAALDALVLRALSLDRDARQPTASALAGELAAALPPAPSEQVAEWVERVARTVLEQRRARVRDIESHGEPAEPQPEITRDAIPAPVPAELAPTEIAQSVPPSPVLSIPLPEPPPVRSRWRNLGLSLLAAAVVIGSTTYAWISLRGDLERDLGPPKSQSELAARPAPPPPMQLTSSGVEPEPYPLPSASAGRKPKPVPLSSAERAKQRLSAHCNPPYVILSTGQKVKKLACE